MSDTESEQTKAEFDKIRQELSSVEESLALITEKNKRLQVTINDRQTVVDRQKTQIQLKQDKINQINQKVRRNTNLTLCAV